MEVHAHPHTIRKKWTYYLWEFLILFFAPFIGSWKEIKQRVKINNLTQ